VLLLDGRKSSESFVPPDANGIRRLYVIFLGSSLLARGFIERVLYPDIRLDISFGSLQAQQPSNQEGIINVDLTNDDEP